MILDKDQLKKAIIDRPNAGLVKKGQEYNKLMRKHFYGFSRETIFEEITDFEKPTVKTLRAKYSRTNKDLMARLTRPIDKVFSARGGSLYYNLPEAKERLARELAKDVKGGVSIKKWIENTWRAHYLDDPYGLIFMEISQPKEVARLRQAGKSFVYPTYKSIQYVHDYLPNESYFEYVIFTVDNQELKEKGIEVKEGTKVFRVIDDAFDKYVKLENDEVLDIPGYTVLNYFTKVPAVTMSDISDPNINGGKLSVVDEIIELASEFLLTGSIKVTHKFLHGFPKYWEYVSDCNACDGHGMIDAKKCETCRGTGKAILGKVSDVKHLSFPESKEMPIVTPDIAGYVSPDKVYYEIATHDMQMLEDLMSYTLWGSSGVKQTQGMSMDNKADVETATQVMNEIKPQADRLTPISHCAESRHKFILDNIILIQINQAYKGASVNYGNRYMLEGPDEIWLQYSTARKENASESVLDGLLTEYYEAAYFNDPIEFAIKMKLAKVEPGVHLSIEQVKNLGYDELFVKKKMYFGDWKRTLQQGALISMTAEELISLLTEYVSAFELPVPIEQQKLEFDKSQAKFK